MAPVVRETLTHVATAVITAVATALLQWAFYAVTIREDVHELQRDVSGLSCRVAILTGDVALPTGCIENKKIIQSGGTR